MEHGSVAVCDATTVTFVNISSNFGSRPNSTQQTKHSPTSLTQHHT